MNKQVLFLQGGGGYEDHEADAKLVTSLRESLGDNYTVHYPFLPDEPFPDFGRNMQIDKAISLIDGEIILVAHSLGASMLLKYMSESSTKNVIVGIFLLATPYWSGDEEWVRSLKLNDDFADNLPGDVPLFFYQCEDDEEVPFDHLEIYAQKLPHATVRTLASGGHQFNNDLSSVAKDILSLG